ncbi:hypothetical protein RB623_26205 [Mesorhizobium sp. LHD-90]|uniref:hypothetical protein n=1 Tax=Mesorhizobium sp. LHD-90 TaxID=3071414 RepID=UPI0027E01BF2|nr:hypothetical protein [Mesorhizobium sp. LHD-90]MDQ6437561.1 hypothetical protein [Mesorhizobium sp. LHD-90]
MLTNFTQKGKAKENGMKEPPYTLTEEDKKLIGDLLLELCVELDMHYDDTDMHALKSSFELIGKGVALLGRLSVTAHPDINAIQSRYNRSNQ